MIKIELNDEEALKFRKYMENYDNINLLIERGIFQVKNGSVVLDFDKDSILQTIRCSGYMYSKRHEQKKYLEPIAYVSI